MARESGFVSLLSQLPLLKRAGFALLFLCAVSCFGSFGKDSVLAPSVIAPTQTKLTSRFAIADFDGDNRPDLATVETGRIGVSRTRYWIGFQLSTGARQVIGVNAPVGGLDITSRDVNGDQRLDLIVTTSWLNQPVAVLLNDGQGNFTLTDPSAYPAIVWSTEKIARLSPLDAKDAAIAALTRASGDCSLNDRVSGASVTPELLAAAISRRRVFTLFVAVAGRAPPLVLHV
jgi:hypothetical protein